MKNPHIIVGPGRRCLCGVYGDKDIRCNVIISALEQLESFGIPGQKTSLEDLRSVITPLIQDCEQPLPELAGVLYEEYCAAVGGKALPDWETFRADPTKKKQFDAVAQKAYAHG